MATANTFAGSLNANFKEVYADKIENLIPDGVKVQNEIAFSSRDSLGNLFHQPVILGHEHGVTFAGSLDDAFALNAPVAGVIKDAQIRGNPMVLRSTLGYVAASRSANGGAKAFEDSTKFLVRNMMSSMTKKLEISLMYGQMGLGTVASTAGNTATIVTAEWAPGIWAGASGMPVEFRSSAGTLRGLATIQTVDMAARTITVDLLPAGVIGTDIIWFKGAYGNEMAGIHKVLSNTGVIFGIDAAQYDLFKASSESAGNAALSFSTVQLAISKAVEKGLDSDVMVLVNPRTWADLLTEQAALRQYDTSYKSSMSENGSQEITFYGQNGKVQIVASIYVREGYAYVLCLEEWSRIGSTDITFKRPGQGDEFFRELNDNAGFELRSYTDQAIFCYAPGKNALITNIVNS